MLSVESQASAASLCEPMAVTLPLMSPDVVTQFDPMLKTGAAGQNVSAVDLFRNSSTEIADISHLRDVQAIDKFNRHNDICAVSQNCNGLSPVLCDTSDMIVKPHPESASSSQCSYGSCSSSRPESYLQVWECVSRGVETDNVFLEQHQNIKSDECVILTPPSSPATACSHSNRLVSHDLPKPKKGQVTQMCDSSAKVSESVPSFVPSRAAPSPPCRDRGVPAGRKTSEDTLIVGNRIAAAAASPPSPPRDYDSPTEEQTMTLSFSSYHEAQSSLPTVVPPRPKPRDSPSVPVSPRDNVSSPPPVPERPPLFMMPTAVQHPPGSVPSTVPSPAVRTFASPAATAAGNNSKTSTSSEVSNLTTSSTFSGSYRPPVPRRKRPERSVTEHVVATSFSVDAVDEEPESADVKDS